MHTHLKRVGVTELKPQGFILWSPSGFQHNIVPIREVINECGLVNKQWGVSRLGAVHTSDGDNGQDRDIRDMMDNDWIDGKRHRVC